MEHRLSKSIARLLVLGGAFCGIVQGLAADSPATIAAASAVLAGSVIYYALGSPE